MTVKNILVTGGRGFIGFNALQRWKNNHPDFKFVNVDALTYADQFMLDKKNFWLQENGIPIYTLDLAQSNAIELVDLICLKHDIDTIVDFHAESHVDNSIANPTIFFKSNVLGTTNLLEVARKRNLRFHYVSTDEVIGSISPEQVEAGFKDASELAPYDPSSPYSSSKASCELIVQSYSKTFGVRSSISRCTNNFGPWQHIEKFIPVVVGKILKNQKIPIYGNGLQRRYWIHVDQHNDALMQILLASNISSGTIYNISPKTSNLKTNIELVEFAAKFFNKKLEDVIEHVEDRLAHDICYWLDSNRLRLDLEWIDTGDFENDMTRTFTWYQKEVFNAMS